MREPTVKIISNLRPDPKHAVFIINPVSGLGDAKTRFQIIKIAKEYGWTGKSYETTIKLSAGDIAKREIKKGTRHLVVCGGDGTIMSVLQAVIKRDVIVGIVPLGTGNLLAQNLKVNLNIKKSINTALHGRVHKIDLGLANGIFFAIIAGIGLDAELMINTDRKAKNKLGFMSYIIGGFKTLGHSSGLYSISIDGKKARIYKAKSIMIANMGRLLGGFEAVSNTRADNGVRRIGVQQA